MKKLAVIFTLLFSTIAFSQEDSLTRILFILDASNSMNDRWENNTRIAAAKKLLSKTVDDLRGVPNLEIALRVYGHQSPITPTYQDCNDTKLEVPFGPDNFTQVKNKVTTIRAKGTTPIALSLKAAAEDFPDNNARNIIILITDGLEACPNDPCVIAKELHDKGVKVTPFVIGLGMDLSYLENFKCIGSFSEAETEDAFDKVLQSVIQKVLVNTTVQINLNDISSNPTETDVTMFLYEAGTHNLKYTYTHTMNRYGNPDTLILDPEIKYDLVVNTTPKVEKKNITILKNRHNIIEVDCPQGYLEVRFSNSTKTHLVEARVMQNEKAQTLNTQSVGEKDKYLVGWYDIEILTLPRIYVTTKIDQSSTTYVDIKAPGFVKYSAAIGIVGQIFIENENGTWDWVCNLDEGDKSGNITLQPGSYRLVYRQIDLHKSEYTLIKDFRINSNLTTSLTL